MAEKELINLSICKNCRQMVPTKHVERDGKMFLAKDCPRCGKSEFLASTDAARYKFKREMCGYKGEAESTCNMRCLECNHGKPPSLVFIDVTNRCNMNCPICLANIPAMGFRFNPPIEYFEKIFKKLSQMKPLPKIQLFGGEPTVRDDLIDIIKLAYSYGIPTRVVTNGIRLADEEYCRNLVDTKAQLMFAFDGRDESIYRRIRKNPKALELKLKALENVRKYHKSKVTIMCTAGYGVNDQFMGDLIKFCHENRDFVSALDLIPLTAHWGPEKVDAHSSTNEDVERMISEALPGTKFFPAGILYMFQTLKEVFDVRLTFGGAHPNCESVSLLISDGEKYRPFSEYLKIDQDQAVIEAVKLDKEMGEKLKKSLLAKILGKTGKRIVYGWTILKTLKRVVNLHEVFGAGMWSKILKILLGLFTGKKLKNLIRKHSRCQGILRLMVLPFEEEECVESARLMECPAAFAYEHPVTKEIHFMPVCSWPIYKNDVLRETTRVYGIAGESSDKTDLLVKEQSASM